ncbi:hypothetical protein [Burkholderia thailandensis]|uniref:hypothetical protein n=1 Tax=Burkholderia thailandensis TaxID=57975 RepID=UPI0012FDD465|nr:hypothetical protein [Burkholderia thailandensis]
MKRGRRRRRQHRWLLAAGCWLLAAGCWLLAAGCWPPASNDLDVPAFIAIIAINAEVKR